MPCHTIYLFDFIYIHNSALEQIPGRTGEPMERGARAGLLEGLENLWKGYKLEQFVEKCSPWEELTLEKLMEDCLMWEGPHTRAGKDNEECLP